MWRGIGGILAALVSCACLDRPVGLTQPQTTNVLVNQLVQNRVDKIDLLFVIDNSLSMADKQAILADALPDLVDRFVSPICVDKDGQERAHPATAREPCPEGSNREFHPVDDIHIGVITTSLGGYGAPFDCIEDPHKEFSEQTVDMAHLMGGQGYPKPRC